MRAPYTLDIIYEELKAGNGLKIIVNNNAEQSPSKIILMINIHHSKKHTVFGVSIEFCDGNNRIDDINSTVKDRRFWRLIEYYQKEVIDTLSKESSLLNYNKIAHESEENVQERTNLRTAVAKGIFSRSGSKINKTLSIDFLLVLRYILQGLNVYTSCKGYNQEEITIARTYIGANAYRNLTLFDRKFPGPLFSLHLANVMLATQLLFKPTRDLITRIQKRISYLRRRALPYSGIAAVVHGFASYYFAGSPDLFKVYYDESQLWNLLNIVIFPLIYPITAFLLRTYGSKIVAFIIKHNINRILKP